jgi:SAM-dependent methyltransferase
MLEDGYLELRWAQGYEAYATRGDMELLQRWLPPPPATVLDVPCGHGRLVERLVAMGYAMAGLDLSPSAVSTTRSRISNALVVRADMARPPLAPDRVDAVICMGNSLLFTEDSETAAFLAGVERVLRPEGVFLLRGGHRDSYVRANPGRREWTEEEGLTAVQDEDFDPIAGIRTITTTHTTSTGATRTRQTKLRLYTVTELTRLLRDAGLEPNAWHSEASQDPVSIDSAAVTIVARPERRRPTPA